MSFLDLINQPDKAESGSVEGVANAIVTNNQDPNNWGRVKVKYIWREGQPESDWARIVALAGGKDRGTLWRPEVDDEVLVAFEKGDIDHPYILGGLWNGTDLPPEDNADGENNTKMFRTRSGHQLKFFEKQGQESIEIKTQGGHVFVMDDSAASTRIEIKDSSGSNKLTIDTTGNSITIESGLSLKIKSQSIDIEAGASLSLKASGTLTLQGALVKIN